MIRLGRTAVWIERGYFGISALGRHVSVKDTRRQRELWSEREATRSGLIGRTSPRGHRLLRVGPYLASFGRST